MRYKFAVPIFAIALGIVGTNFASAQVVPENAPLFESRSESAFKAPYRERTILRPQTPTGESRGTPNEPHNHYLEPGS